MADLTARQEYWRERMWSYLGERPEPHAAERARRGHARPRRLPDREDHLRKPARASTSPRTSICRPEAGGPIRPSCFRSATSAAPRRIRPGSAASPDWRAGDSLRWPGIPSARASASRCTTRDWHDSKVQASTVEHTIIGTQCLLTGTHVAQYTIWDGIRALDYLLSRPEVDPKRVGCTGNSGGGTHTAYLSGLDDRIQVAAPSCYITSWKRMLESIGPQDAEQVFPLWLRDGLDYPDYIYAFAGKPFLMLTAIRDFFPIGGARASFDEVRQVYGKLGLADRVAKFEADDGHGYSKPRREAAYRWFTRWLQGAENTEARGAAHSGDSGRTAMHPHRAGADRVSRRRRRLFDESQTGGAAEGQPEADGRERPQIRRGIEFLSGCAPDRFAARASEKSGVRVARGKTGIRKRAGNSGPGAAVRPERRPRAEAGDRLCRGRGKSQAAAEAEQLAAKGYIVLVPDVRGFGETQPALDRRDYFVRNFGDYENTLTALVIGKTMVGMRAADLVRGVDLLAARNDVDPSRIAAVGRSAAAIPALFAALFDQRITSLALDGMLVSYEAVVNERIHQGMVDQIVPSALKYFDLPDVDRGHDAAEGRHLQRRQSAWAGSNHRPDAPGICACRRATRRSRSGGRRVRSDSGTVSRFAGPVDPRLDTGATRV